MSSQGKLVTCTTCPFRCFRPKNGESWEDVQARADQFLRRLVDSHLQTAPRKSEMNQEGPVDGFANALKPKSDCIYGEGATDKAFPPEPESGNGLPAGDEPPRRMLRSGSFTGGTRTINHVPQSIPLGAYTAPQNQMRRSGSFSSRLRGIKRVPSSELQGLGAASGGRMLRSGSFTGEPRAASHILGIPRSESFGEGGGGRMLRSGSFTGEPRAAGHILGIPRSESFGDGGESAPPRVTGVKRAGSFNALAPKVMKRVDSLGLSKLFTDEMQVGGGADTARERGGSSGSGSDDDELEGAGLEAGGIIGRDRGTGGDLGGRESVSVWSDSDCNDGEMQIIELGPGGPSRDEEMEAAEKVEKTEERRPSGNGRAGNSWEAGEGKKENGRRTDSQGFAGAEEGPSPGEGLGIRGFAEGKGEPWRPSGRGTDGKERPKGRRKGGRPSVKRVLVVTHGAPPKKLATEFTSASMWRRLCAFILLRLLSSSGSQ